MPSQNEKYLTIGICTLLGLMLLSIFLDKDHQVVKQKQAKQNNESLNRSLQDVAKKIEFQQMKAQLENQMTAPKLGENSTMSSESDRMSGITLATEDLGMKAVKDVQLDRRPSSPTAEDRIEQEIELKKFMSEYNKNLNKAYLKEFVENAREGGYHVVLNDQSEVIKVQKIRKSPR